MVEISTIVPERSLQKDAEHQLVPDQRFGGSEDRRTSMSTRRIDLDPTPWPYPRPAMKFARLLPGCIVFAFFFSLSLSLSLFPSLASLLPSAYERQRLGFGVYIQHSIGIGGYVCILPVRITERRSMPWCCWPDVRAQGYRNTRQAEDQQKKKRKVLEESRRRDATR